jgi:hypothetical protein
MKNLEAASDKLPRLRGACPLCRAPLCILGLVRGCIMIVTWPSDETWQLMAVVGHRVSPKHRETPRTLIKSISLRHVLRFRNITPSLRSLRPSFLILKPETSRVLGAASKTTDEEASCGTQLTVRSVPGRAPLGLFGTCRSCRNNRVLR